MRNIQRTLFFLLIPLCYFSCSLDYGDKEEKKSSSPEFVFYNTNLSRFENGKLSTVLLAEELEQYSNEDSIYGKNLSFTTYNSNGETTMQGSCKMLSANTNTELYYLFDDVLITNIEQNLQIKAENLKWDNNTEQLVSSGERKIILKSGETKNSETETNATIEVQGDKFSASGIDNSYYFAGPVSGVIVTEN